MMKRTVLKGVLIGLVFIICIFVAVVLQASNTKLPTKLHAMISITKNETENQTGINDTIHYTINETVVNETVNQTTNQTTNSTVDPNEPDLLPIEDPYVPPYVPPDPPIPPVNETIVCYQCDGENITNATFNVSQCPQNWSDEPINCSEPEPPEENETEPWPPSSNDTIVYVNPRNSSVVVNQTFSVNITCIPSMLIKSYEFNLEFNSSLLQVNSILEGNIFAGYASNFDTISSDGNVWIAGWIIGYGLVSSNGTFATISFTTLSNTGVSPLNMMSVSVCNDTEYVPIQIYHGIVNIV